MNRRSLLAATALGIATSLGGCSDTDAGGATSSSSGSEPAAENATVTRPDECPETSDVEVSLPDDATESKVETFVREYEEAVVADSIGNGERVTYGPTAAIRDVEDAAAGTIVHVRVTWSTTTTMGTTITAEVRDTVPADASARDVESLPADADRVADVAREAVADGESARWEHNDIDHEPILSALERVYDDTETYFVTVDGQPVRVRVFSLSEGVADGEGYARYYVGEAVIRRTTDDDRDPRDGELVACFPAADD